MPRPALSCERSIHRNDLVEVNVCTHPHARPARPFPRPCIHGAPLPPHAQSHGPGPDLHPVPPLPSPPARDLHPRPPVPALSHRVLQPVPSHCTHPRLSLDQLPPVSWALMVVVCPNRLGGSGPALPAVFRVLTFLCHGMLSLFLICACCVSLVAFA